MTAGSFQARGSRRVWLPVVAVAVLLPLVALMLAGSALLVLAMPVFSNGRVASIAEPCRLADAGLLRSLGVNLATSPSDDQPGAVAGCQWAKQGSSAGLDLNLACSQRYLLTSPDSEAHQYFQKLLRNATSPTNRHLFGRPERINGLGDEAVLYGGDFLQVRSANVVWYMTLQAPTKVLMVDARHINEELQAGRSS